jgi:hypothetical protein
VRLAANLDERANDGASEPERRSTFPSLDLLILDLTELTAVGPRDVRTLVRLATELGAANVGLGPGDI